MDFEAIALSTLLRDMPIEMAVDRIKNSKIKELLNSDFQVVARRVNPAFTESELRLLSRVVEDIPTLLEEISERLLTLNSRDELRVKFDNLLRWRNFSLIVGEDALSTSYLAYMDRLRTDSRTDFHWKDVLPHDKDVIHDELKKGLSDVHAHYFATAPLFHVNWISLVNGLEKEDALKVYQAHSMNIAPQLHATYSFKTLRVAACYLRVVLFKVLVLHYPFTNQMVSDLWRILGDDIYREIKYDELKNTMAALADNSYTDYSGNRIDYALTRQIGSQAGDAIHIIAAGERHLLYQFFLQYYRLEEAAGSCKAYFYLYLLIKNRIRQELVQTNELRGFLNFKHYQDRKTVFMENTSSWRSRYPQFVVQSSLDENDKIELRIPLSMIERLEKTGCNKSLGRGREVVSDLSNRLSFVVSLGKQEDKNSGYTRWYAQRNRVSSEIKQLIVNVHQAFPIPITGVDACGNELDCRPEVFAHAYRYAKASRLVNRTFHVGEDFYDLVDGLRAIDEAVRFLELDHHSRIGHALALGVDVHRYYENRRNNIIMPAQYVLDDYVWLYWMIRDYDIKCPESLLATLETSAIALYYKIGYKETFSMLDYYQSWLMRGNDITDLHGVGVSIAWDDTAVMKGKMEQAALKNKRAVAIYKAYLENSTIRDHGNQTELARWPETISDVITELQHKMRTRIAERGIAVECNPTSNLLIGPFEKYEEHPIFQFSTVEAKCETPTLNVSINTDDRGVFDTSLYNEYSLIAASLYKQKNPDTTRKWNDEAIVGYLSKMRQNGLKQRFR